MTAKERPAHFVALVHNLLLVQDRHEQQRVTKTAATERKAKRLEQPAQALTEQGRSLPLIDQTLQRCTQATCKRIRWLRVHWHRPTLRPQALPQRQPRDTTL